MEERKKFHYFHDIVTNMICCSCFRMNEWNKKLFNLNDKAILSICWLLLLTFDRECDKPITAHLIYEMRKKTTIFPFFAAICLRFIYKLIFVWQTEKNIESEKESDEEFSKRLNRKWISITNCDSQWFTIRSSPNFSHSQMSSKILMFATISIQLLTLYYFPVWF